MKFAFFKKYLSLKLLSLVLAFLLWLYVQTQSPFTQAEYSRDFLVDLKIINLPKYMSVKELKPDKVSVTIKGAPQAIERLKPEFVEAYVNLSGKKQGGFSAKIEVNTPLGINVIGKSASRTWVDLDKIVEKVFKVEAEIMGRPQKGFVYGRASVEPEEVLVKGPNFLVSKIKKIKVISFIGGAKENIIEKAELDILDSKDLPVEGLSVKPDRVLVIIPVESEMLYKDLSVLPVIIGIPERNFAVDSVIVIPNTVRATVPRGKEIYFLKTEPVKVSKKEKSFSQKVKIEVPLDVIVDAKTVEVSVKIKYKIWR